MGRIAKPYWKSSHHAYYATINGKLRRLGTDKSEAFRLFHRLMAAAGKPDWAISDWDRAGGMKATEEIVAHTVPSLANTYLKDVKERLAPATWELYQKHLEGLCNHVGKIKMIDLRPFHVTEWLNGKTGWARNRRALAIRIIKIWSRWCKTAGYIDRDPIADLKGTTITRRTPPPPGTIEKLRAAAAASSPELATFIEVSLLTGCRPGELEKLSASQIDWEAKTITVIGKTGPRKIPLTDRLADILRPLAARYPGGQDAPRKPKSKIGDPGVEGGEAPSPLLRTPHGLPWTTSNRRKHLARACKKAGIPRVCSYMTRGIYATEALRNGVEGIMVSKLLGHSDNSIVYKYYAAPDDEMIKRAAEKAIGEKP